MPKIVYGYHGWESGFGGSPGLSFYHGRFDDGRSTTQLAEVRIEQGYKMDGYDFAFADPPAAGRYENDEYSQSPYFIPLTVDPNTDETALKALALGVSYDSARTIDAVIAQAVNDDNNQVAMFGSRLAAAMSKYPNANPALMSDAQSWLQQSGLFQDIGLKIVNGVLPASRFPEWQQLGHRLATNGNTLANTLGLPTFTLHGMLGGPGFPAALKWLKFLLYGGIAITGLYFGAQVLGLIKQRRA